MFPGQASRTAGVTRATGDADCIDPSVDGSDWMNTLFLTDPHSVMIEDTIHSRMPR